MKELYDKPKKSLLRKRKATTAEPQPSKKLKLRTETIDELRNYLRIVDFEKSSQDRESLEAISMIRDFMIIHSPDGYTYTGVRGWYNASYAGRKKIPFNKRAYDQDVRLWDGS
ncbi:hypothetical protein Tco_0714913 [Tanacetum coccineum]